jgi:hypothetical protein
MFGIDATERTVEYFEQGTSLNQRGDLASVTRLSSLLASCDRLERFEPPFDCLPKLCEALLHLGLCRARVLGDGRNSGDHILVQDVHVTIQFTDSAFQAADTTFQAADTTFQAADAAFQAVETALQAIETAFQTVEAAFEAAEVDLESGPQFVLAALQPV